MNIFNIRTVYSIFKFGHSARTKFIVQLGPGLKSKTKAFDQSRTLNSLWIHHPPTKNFLQGSRHSKFLPSSAKAQAPARLRQHFIFENMFICEDIFNLEVIFILEVKQIFILSQKPIKTSKQDQVLSKADTLTKDSIIIQ